MRKVSLVCIGLVLGVTVLAQPSQTALATITTFQAFLRQVEPLLTPRGVTNARNIWTRLDTLKTQFKPAASVVDCVVNGTTCNDPAWGECQDGAQARIVTCTPTITTPPSGGGEACPAPTTRVETRACSVVPPPTGWTFTASPMSIAAGQSTVLSFTTTTADVHRLTLNGQRPVYTCEATSCKGSLTVSPTQTTTYTLRSSNAAGTPYPELTTTITVTGTVPTPTPTTEICDNGTDDDGDGRTDRDDSECATPPPPPPPSGTYPFFDEQCAKTDAACYGLRTQAQVDQYRFGRGVYVPRVDYDATMDAAKWSWPPNTMSAEQIRVPINLQRPASGSSKILIISDHRWDTSWLTQFDNKDGWKWLQVTSNVGEGSVRQQIWAEPQMRFIGVVPDVLSWFGMRGYQSVRAPTTKGTSVELCGMRFGGDSLGPMLNCFKAKPNTWTRAWIEIVETAGDAFARISWWMADETQAPVPIVLNAEMFSYGLHTEFWFEYNSSYDTRSGGPLAAWGRNVIVLTDADVAPTLVKPVR